MVAILIAGMVLAGAASFLSGIETSREAVLAQAAGAATQCDQEYDKCVQQQMAQKKTEAQAKAICRPKWDQCVMNKCSTSVSSCKLIPECQTYCTESATSKGGLSACCKSGPKIGPHMPNPCKDEIDGNCNPQKTDPNKAGMMGGMPPMLPMIPMGMPSMGMPMMPAPDCVPTESFGGPSCEKERSPISDALNNLFGTSTDNPHEPTSTPTTEPSAYRNPMSVLINWLTGGNESGSETEKTVGPTEATTKAGQPPIGGLGNNVGVLQSQKGGQGGTQAQGGTIVGNTFTTDTTFGSPNYGNTSESSGVLANISTTLQTILNWLNNLF